MGTSSPTVVTKGEKVSMSVTITPSKLDGNDWPTRWYIRVMTDKTGKFSQWVKLPADNKTSYDYPTQKGGIYQVKVVLELNNGQRLERLFTRTADDDNRSGLKKGDPDAFGVCDTANQKQMWQNANGKLGSTDWNWNLTRRYSRYEGGQTKTTTFGGSDENPLPKCNMFVAEMGDIAVNVFLVPMTGSKPNWNFPIANQWALMEDIDGWEKVTGWPQPGYVWGKKASGMGHCGIIDYDGQIISAREDSVDRFYKISDGIITNLGKRIK